MLLKTHSFEFGEFLLDAKEKVLLRNGNPLPIRPKVFQLLLVLVENHGHIVEKDSLMRDVWADSFVEESNLTFSIRQVRKILGDDIQNPRFIETIPKRGYRFIGEVREILPANAIQKEKGYWQTFFLTDRNSRLVLNSIFAALVIVFLLSAGFFIWRGDDRPVNKTSARTKPALKFETLTSSNKAGVAAISPDGKFIAYTDFANGRRSLWLRQLSSGINTQIVAPMSGELFFGVEFSPDSGRIFFVHGGTDQYSRLDCISILGGAAKTEILRDLQGWFSLSPDGRQISFVGDNEKRGTLMVAGSDGTGARPLFVAPQLRTITDNAFSPDGQRVAFATGQSDTGGRDFGVWTVEVESGLAKPATEFKWFHVRGVLWLPDESGLIVTARLKNDEPQQLWEISLPGGEVRKIADLQNDFYSISGTSELDQILLTQVSLSSNLYTAGVSKLNDLRLIAQAFQGVAWAQDGNLFYTSNQGGNSDIWWLEAGSTNQKQLTTENSHDVKPRVSPDGRYIVFVSDRTGKYNLWRMNSDGSNPVQLTNGEGEQAPVFTADGQFVVYNSMKDVSLWKVPVEGGEPEQIFEKRTPNVSISPDGTKLAHLARGGNKTKIVIKSFDDGRVLQEFATPDGHKAGRDIVWAKDGRALIYAAEDGEMVGNLWQQPFGGGPPQKLTNYSAGEIFGFDISHDGSQLAIIRGAWNHDVVLLKGFKSDKGVK